MFELLEDRLALTAVQDAVLAVQNITTADLALSGAGANSSPTATNLTTVVNSGSASPSGVGFTPAQIRTAYGLNLLPTTAGGAALDGTGITVAIVDAFNDTNIFTDLDGFDNQFGTTTSGSTLLAQYGAASSFLTVLNQSGKSGPLPISDPGGPSSSSWELEESLDIEWLHAIAPGAKIVLVEANTTSWSDLTTAALSASQIPGVSVVSMSWGISESGTGTAGEESTFDATMAALPGVSFVAATGDQGTAALYPAASPDVLSVGGTSLVLNSNNSYQSETGWSNSAGGFSQDGAMPAYQNSVLPSSQTKRSSPDVVFDGNPNTGVVVYDSYDNTLATPWSQEGGTSLGTPVWAGLIALANQGRLAAGESVFNTSSATEMVSSLYSLPGRDFHDITSGSNKSFSAAAGFDQVTGLGTPVANLLVPDLINYGSAVSLVPGSLATGTINAAYSQSITASGGTGPKTMTYNITSGTLPAGMSLQISNSELDIVGTPLTSGSVSFTVKARDTSGVSSQQSYVLNINALPPSVAGIGPAAGPLSGGTTVTITGTNLANATAVLFGTTPAAIVSDSANQIVVTSPAGLPGTFGVTVTTSGGTSPFTSAAQFSYVAAPTVTNVNPPSQQSAGGQITITGSNLLGTTAVNFGNIAAIIVSDTQTQIVVIGPNFPGTVIVDVTVTTVGGTSAITPADQFVNVLPAPTVALVLTPPAISNQSAATFTFAGTGDASTPTDQLTYEVSLDGGAFAPASSPVAYSGLADGNHTFQVEAIDLNGIASSWASYGWFIDTVAPTSSVNTLAYATSLTSFSVSWSGSDAGQSSGIKSYNVYVSMDSGAFVPWLTSTTQSSATFAAQLGHTYGFYSTAQDNAGNTEAAPSTADATIAVTSTPWQNPANPLDANGSGSVSALDALVIINYLNNQGAGALPATNPSGAAFLDVNGDNLVTALDALQIINYLNGQNTGATGSVASGGQQSLASPTPSTTTVTTNSAVQLISNQSPISPRVLASQTANVVASAPPVVVSSPAPASTSSEAEVTVSPVTVAPATANSSPAVGNSVVVAARTSGEIEPSSGGLVFDGLTPSGSAVDQAAGIANQAADNGSQPLPAVVNNAGPAGLSASGRWFLASSRTQVLAAVDAALAGFGDDELS